MKLNTFFKVRIVCLMMLMMGKVYAPPASGQGISPYQGHSSQGSFQSLPSVPLAKPSLGKRIQKSAQQFGNTVVNAVKSIVPKKKPVSSAPPVPTSPRLNVNSASLVEESPYARLSRDGRTDAGNREQSNSGNYDRLDRERRVESPYATITEFQGNNTSEPFAPPVPKSPRPSQRMLTNVYEAIRDEREDERIYPTTQDAYAYPKAGALPEQSISSQPRNRKIDDPNEIYATGKNGQQPPALPERSYDVQNAKRRVRNLNNLYSTPQDALPVPPPLA